LPLLKELSILLSLCNSKKGEKQRIHLVKYESNANDDNGDEWMGKIKHLSKVITETNKQIEKNFYEKLSVVKREIFGQMHEEIE